MCVSVNGEETIGQTYSAYHVHIKCILPKRTLHVCYVVRQENSLTRVMQQRFPRKTMLGFIDSTLLHSG